ncbi:MAG: molybdopterin-dependent oxidoreductase [Acidobacteria bacterium]|nr:molybdopterin-dependent oxidoreductase [Acidobacteriota bacterium]
MESENGRRKTRLGFKLNGEEVEVACFPHKTLLEVLREDLGLTGTKHGCELGECGTCTVVVDGKAILSCLALGLDMEGREVTTVEGMAHYGQLHPLQDTFAELGATQCGYCTPGILLAAKQLLDDNREPTREQIKEALSGNLCRCTGYLKIFEAVEMAVRRGEEGRECYVQSEISDSQPPTLTNDSLPSSPLKVVGKHFRKVDARAKCTGQTRYADDILLPRILFAKLLRSPLPHARIKRIDLSKALAVPGVAAIITGRDLPIPYGILPVSQDEHTLCIEKVRMVGDPVAAVAAIDEDAAVEAANSIVVEYERFEAIGSIEEALKKPDPRIHEYGDGGNIHKKVHLQFGDPDSGFAEADLVRDDIFFYEGNTHLPLEQHAAVAHYDADGKLVLWTSTQTPHYVHRALAKVLELPGSHIRVIATPNGGGFGGKTDPFNHEIAVSKLAMITGRPVKITLTREEVFYCHRGRHPVLMQVRTGVKRDGSITAMDFQSFLDGGAYGSYGVASTFYTGALQTVTYRIPHYRFRGLRAFTNKAPCGPKRGHGTPQPRFALEIQLDKIAEDLSLDPAEMRKKHLAPPHSLTANFLRIGSMGLGQCIDKVVEASGWKEKFRKLPSGRGVGIACGSYLSGAGLPIYWNNMPHSGVQLRLDRQGGVCVMCGSTEIGQGSDSVLAYIVAEILGIDPFDIRVVTGDTDLTPVDLGSYSSRVTLMTGNAAIEAAERARELLVKSVAEKLSVPESRIALADRRVFDLENPENYLSFSEAVSLAEARFGTIGTVGSYTPPASAAKFKGGGVGPSPAYSYTAAVAEVRVDPETGIVAVESIWIAHDIGRAINPAAVIGQVEGSVYMGLGEALMEEMAYRAKRNLVHKFPSMLEYKSPTTKEMCEITTFLIEDPDPNGPFGAKEVGQGPLLPIPPVIANAVYDAVGVRIDEVPITPEKVLAAIRAKALGKDGRYGPRTTPQIEWPEALRMLTPQQGGDGTQLPRHAVHY